MRDTTVRTTCNACMGHLLRELGETSLQLLHSDAQRLFLLVALGLPLLQLLIPPPEPRQVLLQLQLVALQQLQELV